MELVVFVSLCSVCIIEDMIDVWMLCKQSNQKIIFRPTQHYLWPFDTTPHPLPKVQGISAHFLSGLLYYRGHGCFVNAMLSKDVALWLFGRVFRFHLKRVNRYLLVNISIRGRKKRHTQVLSKATICCWIGRLQQRLSRNSKFIFSQKNSFTIVSRKLVLSKRSKIVLDMIIPREI